MDIETKEEIYVKVIPPQPEGDDLGGITEEEKEKIYKNEEELGNKITKFYASNQSETHITDSDNGKIQDMMLYGKSSQDGTPSPENPVEIKSVVNPVIKICGKNLFDSKKFPIILNRAIDTNTGNLYESLSGNYCATEKYIPFPYSGKKVSFNASMSLCAYDKDYKFISTVNKNNGQVPTGTMYVRFDIKTGDKDKAQIELSENATTYEPYKEQTIQLPVTLKAIQVSSGGNVTINGQQYIADYVDVENGKIVKYVKKIFIKTFRWRKAINKGVLRFYGSTIDAVGIDGNKVIRNTFSLSSHFTFVTSTPDRIGTFTVNTDGDNANIGFAFSTDTTTSPDDFNNWILNNKPFVLLPVLKEELPLTLEQTQALKELVTYYPVTNININSDQLDGYTVFNYPISMSNGWNYVKQQLNDNRDYIYDMDTKTQDIDTQAAEAYVNSEYAVALTELEV